MPTAIDVMANENAEYTNTVIDKAADIIGEMAAGKQDWTAVMALEEAEREFRNQNGHGEINFTLTALINSLNRHLAAATEDQSNQPKSLLQSPAPGYSPEEAATTLRDAANKVAREVHEWTIRTEQTLLEIAQLPITEEDIEEDIREAVREVREK